MSHSGIRISELSSVAGKIPANEPVIMLNLLRFRPKTQYDEGSGFSEVSGVEGYTRYREAFNAVVTSLNIPITLVHAGKAYPGLVPNVGKWDAIALVKYPSFAVFRQIVESEEYINTAQPHRLASLEDWYFMPTSDRLS